MLDHVKKIFTSKSFVVFCEEKNVYVMFNSENINTLFKKDTTVCIYFDFNILSMRKICSVELDKRIFRQSWFKKLAE